MDNNAFQDALDTCFDKFHGYVRDRTFSEKALVTACLAACAGSYILITLPVGDVPSLDAGALSFVRDTIDLIDTAVIGTGIAAWSKISVTSNVLTWLDAENNYVKPLEPKPVEPEGDGLFGYKKLFRAVDKKLDSDNWNNDGFQGFLKTNLNGFKDTLRNISLVDAGRYGVSVLVAATIFDAVVLKGMGSPLTDLAHGNLLDYGVESLRNVTEVLNNNIVRVASALSMLAGAKALVLKGDASKAAKKAAGDYVERSPELAQTSTNCVDGPASSLDVMPEDNSGNNAEVKSKSMSTFDAFYASNGYSAGGGALSKLEHGDNDGVEGKRGLKTNKPMQMG